MGASAHIIRAPGAAQAATDDANFLQLVGVVWLPTTPCPTPSASTSDALRCEACKLKEQGPVQKNPHLFFGGVDHEQLLKVSIDPAIYAHCTLLTRVQQHFKTWCAHLAACSLVFPCKLYYCHAQAQMLVWSCASVEGVWQPPLLLHNSS